MIDGPLFSIGSLHFYPYGLCMALGIIGCFVFLLYAFKNRNFNDEAIDKTLFIGIFATAFGVFMAMVFQGLYDYIENPAGGYHLSSMTFQGGLIGGVSSFLIVWNLYVFVIAPRAKSKILSNNMNAALADALPIIPIGITIAHAFGRLGCTFAGCCHGAETDAWYGIWMYTAEYGHVKVVPTQLFECLFLIVLTAIMAVLFFKFKFKYNFGLYAIAYGVWRFIIEFARDDHRGSFLGAITPSQFWSIIMVILGIGYFFLWKYFLTRFEKHPEQQPPVRQPKKQKALAEGGEVVEGTVSVEIETVEVSPEEQPEQPAEPVEEQKTEEGGEE
ncbi:MAG: prolipoprotein diacylglyceryl transferase [Clostridia bacterium]|nr:prolipoprotein diacylglyceryl transferase [Clostridia bacterium]